MGVIAKEFEFNHLAVSQLLLSLTVFFCFCFAFPFFSLSSYIYLAVCSSPSTNGILNIAFTVITWFLLELIACWTFIRLMSRHGGGRGGDFINLHLAGKDGSQIHITG